jgi:hypothetical protein
MLVAFSDAPIDDEPFTEEDEAALSGAGQTSPLGGGAAGRGIARVGLNAPPWRVELTRIAERDLRQLSGRPETRLRVGGSRVLLTLDREAGGQLKRLPHSWIDRPYIVP